MWIILSKATNFLCDLLTDVGKAILPRPFMRFFLFGSLFYSISLNLIFWLLLLLSLLTRNIGNPFLDAVDLRWFKLFVVLFLFYLFPYFFVVFYGKIRNSRPVMWYDDGVASSVLICRRVGGITSFSHPKFLLSSHPLCQYTTLSLSFWSRCFCLLNGQDYFRHKKKLINFFLHYILQYLA